jgi:hypothetical protein
VIRKRKRPGCFAAPAIDGACRLQSFSHSAYFAIGVSAASTTSQAESSYRTTRATLAPHFRPVVITKRIHCSSRHIHHNTDRRAQLPLPSPVLTIDPSIPTLIPFQLHLHDPFPRKVSKITNLSLLGIHSLRDGLESSCYRQIHPKTRRLILMARFPVSFVSHRATHQP